MGGSEASIVIIFDLPKVHFESVSRAVNHLLFITLTQNKSSLRKVLEEIIDKKHDIDTCKRNWKKNSNIFNHEPKTCDYYAGSPAYKDLLLYKILESSDDTDGIDSENMDAIKKNIVDFRIQLAMLEDINDEVSLGFRRQEDLKDSNLGWPILNDCIKTKNMAAFEPYLEKFNELQPYFVKKVKENHEIADVLK